MICTNIWISPLSDRLMIWRCTVWVGFYGLQFFVQRKRDLGGKRWWNCAFKDPHASLYSWIEVLDLIQPFHWGIEIWEPFNMSFTWGIQSWTLVHGDLRWKLHAGDEVRFAKYEWLLRYFGRGGCLWELWSLTPFTHLQEINCFQGVSLIFHSPQEYRDAWGSLNIVPIY